MFLKLSVVSKQVWDKYTRDNRVTQMKEYRQHGNISTYDHCLNVAFVSGILGNIFRFGTAAMNNLIIGSMLHDFYLYDYHKTGRRLPDGIHCWRHPKTALQNAEKTFCLNTRQRNIIRSHMFPTTLLHPPRYKEAWVVTLADKWCAILEYFGHKCHIGNIRVAI